MKISYSNKTLAAKPHGRDIGRYFGRKDSPNRIKFKTVEHSVEDFESIISTGHTLSYQCEGDDSMNRKANYIGTDFIVIDIDSTDLSIDEVLDRAIYQPTIIHTTFSNLTESKNNKFCYHLIYCMKETLFGEANFNYAFTHFCRGIENLIDKRAKDCHRITFTSNSALPNYQYRLLGNTYSATTIGDAPNEYGEYNPTFSLSLKNKEGMGSVKKNNSSLIYNYDNNMNVEKRNLTVYDNTFSLENTFISDLYRLGKREFIQKYSLIYEYITFTPPTILKKTEQGIEYADYRGKEYYELPSLWRTNEYGERERKRIDIGSRTTQLYVETNIFILIKQDITKEHLVYEVVRDVYENYDNTDGQFSSHYILSLVENVWMNKRDFIGHPIPKKFKIIKFAEGMTKQSCVGIVRKLMKDDSIGSIIDINLSLEDNLRELRQLGIKIKKKRLVQFIKDNHLDNYIKSEKRIRNECVMSIMESHPNASCRELADICKEHNISVSHETIRTIRNSVNKNVL